MFEVIRLAPMTDEAALEVARGWPRDHGVDVDDADAGRGARPRDPLSAGDGRPGNVLRLLELVRDRDHARRRDGGDDRDA